ncbi:MAG: hypothetical protein AAGU15_00455 [Anaerolineaceae bacterium]|jgi:hypothetical protein
MKEIAPNIYVEQNSIGLYSGVIRSDTGMVLIDSPLKPIDGNYWKSTKELDQCCQQCYMVVLDTNYDRLLSMKGSDCAIVAHSDAIAPIRNRTPKVSEEPQQYNESPEIVTTGNRMVPPEINYDNELSLYLGDLQIDLEHHSGSNQAGTWVKIPQRQTVFIGDSVVVDQPPFLAYANLEAWENDLNLLSSKSYADYTVISSRSGVVSNDQIKTMYQNIVAIRKTFEELHEAKAPIEEWYSVIPQISARFSQLDLFNSEIFYNRLHWGITTYYELNHHERG